MAISYRLKTIIWLDFDDIEEKISEKEIEEIVYNELKKETHSSLGIRFLYNYNTVYVDNPNEFHISEFLVDLEERIFNEIQQHLSLD